MPHVVIATTMWSKVGEEGGIRREDELKRVFWKEMVAGGCRVERFRDTHESAWSIIGSHPGKDPARVLLPHEIGKTRLPRHKIRGSIALNEELEKLFEVRKHVVRKF